MHLHNNDRIISASHVGWQAGVLYLPITVIVSLEILVSRITMVVCESMERNSELCVSGREKLRLSKVIVSQIRPQLRSQVG